MQMNRVRTSRARPWLSSGFCAALLTTVASCGGGGGSSPTTGGSCQASVRTGFLGDLNATYADGFGGDGGAGAGAGAAAGAGAGGGEGKILGGQVTVTRLADGTVLGTATTDATTGLVTISPCIGDLPMLVTIAGTSGAQYFDEGKGQLLPFGPTQSLHALVDTLDENVGASAYTEAAYRYAINHYAVNPAQVIAGTVPLQKTASLIGLSAQQVRDSNNAVLLEVNRLLPTQTQLTTVKSLPTPIDSTAGASALPVNRYGIAAVLTGGLAVQSNNNFPASTVPALDATEQLARDMTDGKLDGFALDGTPAAVPGALTYDAVRLPVTLITGAYSVSSRFGAATTFKLGSGISDFTSAGTLQNGSLAAPCYDEIDDVALLKDGTVNLIRISPLAGQNCASESTATLVPGFATAVKSVYSLARQAFLVQVDGTVKGWGDANCGLLGNGSAMGRFTAPSVVAGLTNITSVGIGGLSVVARDASGAVFTWGSDEYGALGLGGAPAYDVAKCDPVTGATGGSGFGANLRPRQVPGLSDVAVVAVDQLAVFAVDRGGRLFQWGLLETSPPSAPVTATVPTQVVGLSSVVSVVGAGGVAFALKSDGTVWGFGTNRQGNFGDGTSTPKPVPVQVPGLNNIVEIGGDSIGGAAALKADGSVLIWDGILYPTPTTPASINVCVVPDSTSRTCISTSFVVMPKMRHISGNGFRTTFTGIDGTIYFRSPNTNQLIVVTPPSFGAS